MLTHRVPMYAQCLPDLAKGLVFQDVAEKDCALSGGQGFEGGLQEGSGLAPLQDAKGIRRWVRDVPAVVQGLVQRLVATGLLPVCQPALTLQGCVCLGQLGGDFYLCIVPAVPYPDKSHPGSLSPSRPWGTGDFRRRDG